MVGTFHRLAGFCLPIEAVGDAPTVAFLVLPPGFMPPCATPRCAAGKFAPFTIGMTVAFCIMSFGAVTGASINPARTLGPAVGIGKLTQALP